MSQSIVWEHICAACHVGIKELLMLLPLTVTLEELAPSHLETGACGCAVDLGAEASRRINGKTCN